MDLSVIIPAYREAENLVHLLPQLNGVLEELGAETEVLVVDAAVKNDNTDEVCARNGCVHVIRENGELYGDAIRTGIRKASGKYIVVMDADGSHDPAHITEMYRIVTSGETDLVIGSRYCKGGSTENIFILVFMSWVLNVTYRLFFGIKVKDISDSFRMYRAEQLKKLTLECSNFDIVEEILIQLVYTNKDFKIKEIPIRFNKREYGESKRDLFKFILSYIKTIRRMLRIKNQFKK